MPVLQFLYTLMKLGHSGMRFLRLVLLQDVAAVMLMSRLALQT